MRKYIINAKRKKDILKVPDTNLPINKISTIAINKLSLSFGEILNLRPIMKRVSIIKYKFSREIQSDSIPIQLYKFNLRILVTSKLILELLIKPLNTSTINKLNKQIKIPKPIKTSTL